MPKTRVLLADDHAIVAEGLQALLKDSFDLIGVVHDGRALLDAAEAMRPDVIVTDVSMPLMNGLEAIRQIRARRPDAKVVVLTMHRDTQLAAEAFRAGVSGYLLKVSPGDELINAIHEVAAGRSYVTTLLAKDLITLLIEAGGAGREGGAALTPRQREVLQLIAEGRTMKEAASILNISPRTAESHKYEMMQALGVQTTAELIQYAMRLKLIAE
ncbi:MAG TPA: response regulator transcription factor [Bryobacteraceae bacterium]|nr:response regulator transcription factor [Bryobacteraceae bacterium]